MKTARHLPKVLGFLLVYGAALAGEVGGAIDVAPQVAKTQMQLWPRAAWAAESKSWLAVWREGYVNEEATDVWAARVSEGGKALDPAGIRICAAKDRQERACVASDGKGWLVVWEDFRNGKDYDVYAARVSPEGKALDDDGFLVAGGEHNQCYPAVAFAGGNYVVVWMNFVGDTPDGTAKNGVTSGYRLFGTAVSPEGKVATPGGAAISPANMRHAMRPTATAADDGKRVLVVYNGLNENGRPRQNGIASLWVDGASGKLAGTFWEPPAPKGNPDELVGSPLAAAWGKGGGLVLGFGGVPGVRAWRLEASGSRVAEMVGNTATKQRGFIPWFSIACDGNQYLLVKEEVAASKPTTVLGIQARLLPADWKGGGELGNGFFPVASDGKKSCLMGQAASGPKGTFLVIYSEARGVDDVKVQARMVK